MKMFMVVYDRDYDEEVMELLTHCCITGFTKWDRVLGKGARSEPKMDDSVWPGYNCAVLIAVDPELEELVFDSLMTLHKRIGERAIKVFAWPLERVI